MSNHLLFENTQSIASHKQALAVPCLLMLEVRVDPPVKPDHK